jgi:ribonuclease HII
MNRSEEIKLSHMGFSRIIGIDEAGRGPWAGPVVVAGVILSDKCKTVEIDDSKKLSEEKRNELYQHICETCEVFVESASNNIIDKEGILKVVKKLARKIAQKSRADFIILDAFNINLPGITQKALIQGDGKVASIAAASIVAKVTRDRLMVQYDQKYPGYGLAENKGYGTESHQKGLDVWGVSPIHRKSYEPIRQLLKKHDEGSSSSAK